jgi:hypothetical protein
VVTNLPVPPPIPFPLLLSAVMGGARTHNTVGRSALCIVGEGMNPVAMFVSCIDPRLEVFFPVLVGSYQDIVDKSVNKRGLSAVVLAVLGPLFLILGVVLSVLLLDESELLDNDLSAVPPLLTSLLLSATSPYGCLYFSITDVRTCFIREGPLLFPQVCMVSSHNVSIPLVLDGI